MIANVEGRRRVKGEGWDGERKNYRYFGRKFRSQNTPLLVESVLKQSPNHSSIGGVMKGEAQVLKQETYSDAMMEGVIFANLWRISINKG